MSAEKFNILKKRSIIVKAHIVNSWYIPQRNLVVNIDKIFVLYKNRNLLCVKFQYRTF